MRVLDLVSIRYVVEMLVLQSSTKVDRFQQISDG